MTNGWQEVPLGKVLKRADRFEKKDELQSYHFAGTYSFARGIFASVIKEGSTFGLEKIQRIKKGDFIYCKIMAWEGAFGIAPEKVDDYVMSGAFVAYEVDQTQIYPKFLDYYFKQEPVWKSIGSQSTGTNVRRRSLHPDQFEKATIPFPPLDEQRRIVERIEALAARITKAQFLRTIAIEEAEAIEKSARNEIFGNLVKTITPVMFEEIAEMRLGKMLSQASKVGATPLPYLRNANIQWDRLDLSNVNTMDFSEDEKPIFRLKAGDILVCEGGDIGKSAIWNNELPECYFQKALHRIRVNTKLTFSRFVLHHIFWAAEQNHFFEIKTQTTIPHLTGVKLKAYKIYLPALDEQRRIVAYLDSVQARLASLRQLQSASGEELSALMPSILDKGFKGEL